MGLFRTRIRLKHEILIGLDVAIQNAQRAINENKQDQLEQKIGNASTGSERFLADDIRTFNTLKNQLLGNIKKIDKEMDRIDNQIKIITGLR